MVQKLYIALEGFGANECRPVSVAGFIRYRTGQPEVRSRTLRTVAANQSPRRLTGEASRGHRQK